MKHMDQLYCGVYQIPILGKPCKPTWPPHNAPPVFIPGFCRENLTPKEYSPEKV